MKPSEAQKRDFRKNYPYGAYYTKNGERILFNRSYQPLRDKSEWVKNIERQEFFYNDFTPWGRRFHNSENEIVIFES